LIWKILLKITNSFSIQESILPNFFLPFFFFGVKLGHFTINNFFLYVTKMQAYQRKTEKFFISKEKKFGRIDSRLAFLFEEDTSCCFGPRILSLQKESTFWQKIVHWDQFRIDSWPTHTYKKQVFWYSKCNISYNKNMIIKVKNSAKTFQQLIKGKNPYLKHTK